MASEVSLYDAKTHLSALVERAAGGEEIVITKKGKPKAKLVQALPATPREWGKNVMGITWVADDFDAPDPELVALFEGEGDDDDLV